MIDDRTRRKVRIDDVEKELFFSFIAQKSYDDVISLNIVVWGETICESNFWEILVVILRSYNLIP